MNFPSAGALKDANFVVVVADLTNSALLKDFNSLTEGHRSLRKSWMGAEHQPIWLQHLRVRPDGPMEGKQRHTDWDGLKCGERMKESVDIYRLFRRHKFGEDCTSGLETGFLTHLGELQRCGAGLFLC